MGIGTVSPGAQLAVDAKANANGISAVGFSTPGGSSKAHPLVVEEEKDARLKGFYIHPELYGQPQEEQIEWARNPANDEEAKGAAPEADPAQSVNQALARPRNSRSLPSPPSPVRGRN